MHPICGFNDVGYITKRQKQKNYVGGFEHNMELGSHYAPYILPDIGGFISHTSVINFSDLDIT